MNSNRSREALSRRGFLTATGIGALALAGGCGGGGGGNNGTPGERYNGTYFYRDDSGEISASVTIDRNGLVTFWTLDNGLEFTDYGQTRLSDRRFFFETPLDDVETIADVNGSVITGRTERISNRGYGFDWPEAVRQNPAQRGRPPAQFVGTFYADTLVDGPVRDLDVYILLGVSPDGNATFVGYLNDPNDDVYDADGSLIEVVGAFYVYENLSIDPGGEAYNFLRRENGDRITLSDDPSGLRLLYTFALDDRLPADLRGVTVNVGLTEGVSSRATRAAAGKPGAGQARPRRGSAPGADVFARLGERQERRKAAGSTARPSAR